MNKKLNALLPFLTLLVGFILFNSFCPFKNQGIEGVVTFLKGDQMPSPDLPPQSKGRPYQTKIAVFEAAKGSQAFAIEKGPFYQKITTRLIAEIATNEKGAFKLKLPPGTYSVFIVEGGKYYSNIQNGEGVIGAVTVLKHQFAHLELKMDAGATY